MYADAPLPRRNINCTRPTRRLSIWAPLRFKEINNPSSRQTRMRTNEVKRFMTQNIAVFQNHCFVSEGNSLPARHVIVIPGTGYDFDQYIRANTNAHGGQCMHNCRGNCHDYQCTAVTWWPTRATCCKAGCRGQVFVVERKEHANTPNHRGISDNPDVPSGHHGTRSRAHPWLLTHHAAWIGLGSRRVPVPSACPESQGRHQDQQAAVGFTGGESFAFRS